LSKGVSINIGSSSQDVNGRGIINPFSLTFDYLPIPESKQVTENVPMYKDLDIVHRKSLKNPDANVHFDPEFRTYTYGHMKRGFGDIKGLLELKRHDYLFFHATLSHPNKRSLWLTAIIGYFIVEDVHDCHSLSSNEIKTIHKDRFALNAHLKRADSSVDFLICGMEDSRLFNHAIPLSTFSSPNNMKSEFKNIITTTSGKSIDDGKPWHRWTLKVDNPVAIINHGQRQVIKMYTMTNDSGFAPHVNNEWISLACCAGPTREYSNVGDFVLGVSGATMDNVPKHVPIYLMQIDEKMTFDDYFHDERFIGRPDNIYVKKTGIYVQERRNVRDGRYTDSHKDSFSLGQGFKDYFVEGLISDKLIEVFNENGCPLSNKATITRKKEKIWVIRDCPRIFQIKDASRRLIVHKGYDDSVKSEFVLVSRHFYYFGDRWRRDKRLNSVMERFCRDNGFKYTTGGNYKKILIDDNQTMEFLHNLIKSCDVGENGHPNHLPKHESGKNQEKK
jgi:hypothetical protein